MAIGRGSKGEGRLGAEARLHAVDSTAVSGEAFCLFCHNIWQAVPVVEGLLKCPFCETMQGVWKRQD